MFIWYCILGHTFLLFHDDVIKWKHFPRCWPFVWGIHRSRWIPRTKASDAELWCFFHLRLNKRLSKQPWGWWFETPALSLWRHRNVILEPKLLPGNRSHILCDANNVLLNTHRIFISSQYNDDIMEIGENFGRCIKEWCISIESIVYFNFVHCKLHFSSVTLYVRVALV